MALARCRECGRLVDRKAETCPHCGAGEPADQPHMKAPLSLKAIVSLFFLVAVLVFVAVWQMTESEKQAQGREEKTRVDSLARLAGPASREQLASLREMLSPKIDADTLQGAVRVDTVREDLQLDTAVTIRHPVLSGYYVAASLTGAGFDEEAPGITLWFLAGDRRHVAASLPLNEAADEFSPQNRGENDRIDVDLDDLEARAAEVKLKSIIREDDRPDK